MDDHEQEQESELSDAVSQPSLDCNQVSNWLDNHPEFLHDYLKKLQIQRRRTSILSDKSGLILANLHQKSCQNSNKVVTSPTSIQSLTFLNENSSPRFTCKQTPSKSPTPNNLGSNSTTSSIISLPLLLTSNHLNASFSEPSAQPVIKLNLDSEQVFLKQQVSRNKFKQLGLYEKMYTLVKTLYQSLDLKTTCKKILNTVSLLLDADRCSLFLVVDDLDDDEASNEDNDENDTNNKVKKCLVSVVFDAKSNSLNKGVNYAIRSSADSDALNEDEEEDNEQIKIPYGKGIAGYVASTGETLNIPDAYLDHRFNAKIDQQTGYRTKSILCLPILNENGQCVAVAEAINKLSDENDSEEDTNNNCSFSFTKEDEETFGKFMPFIAIAIRNSNLYSQSRKEAQTNKVLLELATIVFDESSTTVDNLVSRILFNSIFLLECERCQVILLNTNLNSTSSSTNVSSRRPSFHVIKS